MIQRQLVVGLLCGAAISLVGCGPQRIYKNGLATSSQDLADASNADDGGTNHDDADATPVGQLPPGVECLVAADCSDGEKCTVDTCVDGQCGEPEPIRCNHDFVCSSANGACVRTMDACEPIDDNDLCTIDGCDPTSGEPVNTTKPCDDELDETVDACNGDTGDCTHTYQCGNCADDDGCTADHCDGDTGECLHDPVACGDGLVCESGRCVHEACQTAADCNDHNPCTADTCDEATGLCSYRDGSSQVCTDNDDQTRDVCSQDAEAPRGFACEHLPRNCEIVDDDDLCTIDACDNNAQAVNVQISCNDGEESTDDSCDADSGLCQYLPRCGEGTVFDQETGQCVPGQVDANCNNGDRLCRLFHDQVAIAVCQGGVWLPVEVCGNADEVVCIEGTGCFMGPGH